ncbi:uncharacterized protein (DUF305 family) [Micromonospora jinlongensis]|uniref:Uncharacterized protein (DUF305 family) n=1 Tax=Micromonospora jinlongensis TaxID=1287877 RepID=A0A7Y9WY69_9ACTN|nr:DUF305 domain-containing protein [Micromonospora jinlongensis]NYH41659.1 uncharacterized protein (DUF305 family) [Micromonospora jinlongensis]
MRAPVSASMSLFLAALLVTACATGSPTTTAPSNAGPSGSVSPSGSASLFSPTDVAWLQLTVAMNERLLPVLDMVPSRTTDPGWQTFAARLGTAHRADLSTARRLLAESGAPATNPHEGHDMPGMVTEQELTTLRSATGVAFQRLAGQHVRAHLQQAVRVATAEQRNGVSPATTALATEVVRAGDAELTRLDRLNRPA